MSDHASLMDKTIGFIDLETTGLNVGIDKICEIAIIKVNYNNSYFKEYHRYINPGIHIPTEASQIHKIYDDTVKNCPKFVDLVYEILDAFSDCDYVCAYNGIDFDKPHLLSEIRRGLRAGAFGDREIPTCLEREWIDPLWIFRNPEYKAFFNTKPIKNLKLVTLCAYFGLPSYKAHNALEDTQALAKLQVSCINDQIVPDTYVKTLLSQSRVPDIDDYFEDAV